MIGVQFIGRLGNQLFQYATCRTLAEKNGYGFYVDSSAWFGGGLFDLDLGYCDGITPTHIFKETSMTCVADMLNIQDGTLLVGFFQGEQFFDIGKARKWFKLKENKEADSLFSPDSCYIHLRGGDVKQYGENKTPLSYYKSAIEVIRTLCYDINFIVLTDDIDFGHEYFPDFTVLSNSKEVDFVLLNKARYVIIANSSFSWWATWLNENNVVIAPHGWNNINKNKWVFEPHSIKVNRFIWI